MSSEDDWDCDDDNIAVIKSKWEDEEQKEEVKEEKKPVKAVKPVKQKTLLKQKIEELEKKEESEIDKKNRIRNAVLDSDLDNVRALVGEVDIDDNQSSFNPKTRDEFSKLEVMLGKKMELLSHSGFYSQFAEDLIRSMIGHLSLEECRKVSLCVNAIINEKQKSNQGQKGKKTKKKMVNVGSSSMMDRYQDTLDYNEFDDFM